MDLSDKCLLVVKPTEPIQHWLEELMAAASPAAVPVSVPELSEELQSDANCYIMPNLPPDQTAQFIKDHAQSIIRTELSTWCRFEEVWPKMNFSNLTSSFKFEFYYDWMNFKADGQNEKDKSLNQIVLLIKPREKFTEYIHTVLVQKFNLSPAEADKKLNLDLIRNGSTAIITDVDFLDEVESFLDRHVEEIFHHQLILWGGEDSQDLWPRDLDLRAFKESFEVEIHRHTYLMLH